MATNKVKVPLYVIQRLGLETTRDFKALKREQLKDIFRAMSEYLSGCAYCPDNELFDDARKNIEKLIDSHSVKRWGR